MKTLARIDGLAFDVLIGQTRSKPDARTVQAARAVLVDGHTVATAAAAAGVSRAATYKAIHRLQRWAERFPRCPLCRREITHATRS